MTSSSEFRPFNVDVERRSDVVIIRFTGEFDLVGANTARAAIEAALGARPPAVALDLRELDYMDSTGLGCLIEATEVARLLEVRLAVLNGVGQAHRMLELTGAGDAFELIDDVSELKV